MNISDLSENKKTHTMQFTLTDADISFANAIRRIAIEEVPTMAIENVEIRRNSSVLYDEIVAHRLGLLPLNTDLKSYNLRAECKCNGEGCARCTAKFSLKAKGPCIVYAEELKSSDPKIKPVHPKTPIVKLLKGQKLELEATAELGQGKVHMKWSSGVVYYTYLPKITVNASAKLAEFKSKYPPQIFDKSGKIDKSAIVGPLIDAVDGVNEDIIKVEYDKNSFVFHVESFEQLSCSEIVETAVDLFTKKLDQLQSVIEEK
ncbi:MAG: DNA-directed RNA polymerase subunit D [Nanoarchaeota archaeon]|nr:MAG: DNA-directed RNA polymerase subunit D [Nanoarchaeota archaeon]